MYKNSPPVIAMFKFYLLACSLLSILIACFTKGAHPVGKRRKLNVHKTFRRCPGRLLNVLRKFNLRPVPRGGAYSIMGIYYDPHKLETTELTISTFPRPLSPLQSFVKLHSDP